MFGFLLSDVSFTITDCGSDVQKFARDVDLFNFQEWEKSFDYLSNRVVFFSRPFHENFIFLKNFHYVFHEFLHSHSTPKVAPACSKASKSYDWTVRNIAKISQKMAKNSPKTAVFRHFSIFSKTVHTIRTKFSRVFIDHNCHASMMEI